MYDFHLSNENTLVKVIILLVIRNYLLLTVSVENTAVKFVMKGDWRTYRKKYQNNPREMSQITSPFPFVHPTPPPWPHLCTEFNRSEFP